MSDVDPAKAIGRIASNFAAMELVVSAAVGTLADVDLATVQELLADDSFDKVITKTRLIARRRLSAEGFGIIDRWLTQAKVLGDRRSQVLHSAWVAAGPDVTAEQALVGFRLRKGEIRDQRLTPLELDRLADEIWYAYKELLGFMTETFMNQHRRECPAPSESTSGD